MMIEKIITKNNQDFQYFSESELKLKKMIAVVIFPICIL